jgi:hypothetical protein
MLRQAIVLTSIVLLSGCNTTARMEIPAIAPQPLLEVSQQTERQPSFALDKIIATIKRGTAFAAFPAGGVPGAEGYLCNHSYRESSGTIDWGTGTTVLGNRNSELGEVFYQTLTSKGLNIAGNPADLFRRAQAVGSAEYLVGARISEIRGNYCEAHHWWDGRPLREYSGETYIQVDWSIFSSLMQREVLRVVTEGYYKQVKSVRSGIVLAFQGAFAAATENLLSSPPFVEIVNGKPAVVAASADPVRYFNNRELSSRSLNRRIESVLPAVVTIRAGKGHGSGFAISEDGLILTNEHVVGTSKSVGIVLNNGVETTGAVLARSEARDVALVQISLRIPSYLPVQTERPNPLDRVYAIGTPLRENLKSTVTSGVVSVIRRDPRSGLSFIQSDVAISPGNSGGPLLDENGNAIAISVAKIVDTASEALNLFIPIDEALDALNLKPRPGRPAGPRGDIKTDIRG